VRAMNESTTEPQGIEVRTYFVRERNALVARAQFSDLFVDYYLHQGQHSYTHKREDDSLLKDALSALTLHCASRPWNETTAWTIHFAERKLNIFVTGDNTRGAVVGQLFTEQVKEDGRNLFSSDIVRGLGTPRRSVVELEKADVFLGVEQYYAQSEQLPARLFRHGDEDVVMVTAHPDIDMAWFESLTEESIRTIDQTNTLALLERRTYKWDCGCDDKKLMRVLSPHFKKDPDALFGDEPIIRMSCPRCGAKYIITREAMEATVLAK
jgi:molecular chaperone Hsp33